MATENCRKFLQALRHRRPSTTALDLLWELIEFIEGPYLTQKLIQRKQTEILARWEQRSVNELLQNQVGHVNNGDSCFFFSMDEQNSRRS